MIRESVEKIIERMVRRIAQRYEPDKIILFGSHATGNAGPDSDVDLLIVLNVRGSKRKLTVEMYETVAGMGLPKDIIIVTPDEVEKYRHIPGTIVRPALRQGKILYERSVA